MGARIVCGTCAASLGAWRWNGHYCYLVEMGPGWNTQGATWSQSGSDRRRPPVHRRLEEFRRKRDQGHIAAAWPAYQPRVDRYVPQWAVCAACGANNELTRSAFRHHEPDLSFIHDAEWEGHMQWLDRRRTAKHTLTVNQ